MQILKIHLVRYNSRSTVVIKIILVEHLVYIRSNLFERRKAEVKKTLVNTSYGGDPFLAQVCPVMTRAKGRTTWWASYLSGVPPHLSRL